MDCLLTDTPPLLTANLGSGQGQSVEDVVQTTNRRPGDADISLADPSKDADRLGWRTQSSLEQICRACWAGRQQNRREMCETTESLPTSG